MSETGAQRSVKIDSLARKTLTNALFDQAFINNGSSDFSQIYVLRKKQDEFLAYHLDISNPTRVNLANEFELRPDDIIFVAAQPLTSYNRGLSYILGIAGITLTARDRVEAEFR